MFSIQNVETCSYCFSVCRGFELREFCSRVATSCFVAKIAHVQIGDKRVLSSSRPSGCPAVPSENGIDWPAILLILVSICC